MKSRLFSMPATLLAALFALMLCLLSGAALAQEARDITNDCTFTSPGRKTTNVHDGLYTSYWNSSESVRPYLEITTPDGEPAEYLYICFGDMPSVWAIEEEVAGEWQTLVEGTKDYYHVVVELGGKTHVRLIDTSGKRTQFKINEVFVFAEGTLPDWVQRWEPAPEKADMLLLVAHPDDELIFFGGTIPTYAAERGLDMVVAYMSFSNTTRRSELLNGLWSLGLRSYPVIGTFYDTYTSKLDDAYSRWRKNNVRTYVMELVRKYKPEVMLTHDVNGEYGHGAHKLCADVAQYCVENADKASVLSDSAAEYGTWQVKKLYLHLYEENAITMNWRVPLESFGGKTGLALAQEAYLFHVTQQSTSFEVTDTGETSNARFGLAFTTVGPDVVGGDFMENIPPKGPSPEPTPEPTPKPTTAPGEKVRADVQWPQGADVELDEAGYPRSGEYVYESDEEGLWFYASPSLVVRIDRFEQEKPKLAWYEAHIYCDTNEERVGSILYNDDNPTKEHVQAELIAKTRQVVFGMNTDYYTYRIGRNATVGMIIRNRRVLYDKVPAANRSQFPNLDTLAMYEDGSWGVYLSDEYTAEEYLSMGAVDVYSFGPYLIRDGELNPFVYKMSSGRTEQPRCAIGIIEPGHYYAMLAEGRMRISVGVTIPYMAEHMQEKGCVQAFNLDGGMTAVFTFMGKQISRIGEYQGSTKPRATTELIGIGRSDLIDPEN